MELISKNSIASPKWEFTVVVGVNELTVNERDMVWLGCGTQRPWVTLQALAAAIQRTSSGDEKADPAVLTERG